MTMWVSTGTIAELNLYEQTELFNGKLQEKELNKSMYCRGILKEGIHETFSWETQIYVDVR